MVLKLISNNTTKVQMSQFCLYFNPYLITNKQYKTKWTKLFARRSIKLVNFKVCDKDKKISYSNLT